MHRWQDDADCGDVDPAQFFEKYEEDQAQAKRTDKRCRGCPVNQTCFAWGISHDEWGVWGGIYLEDGKISKEFNQHKTSEDWFNTWEALTMETE